MRFMYAFTFFLFSFSIYSQSYKPFLAEGKIWVEDYWSDADMPGWGCDGPPDNKNECHTDYYKIEGDTVINNVPYKIMYRRSKNNSPYAESNEYGSFYTYAFLREDTQLKQVFIHESSFYFNLNEACSDFFEFQNQEFKFYDFGLNIGDTIKSCHFGNTIIFREPFKQEFNGDSLLNYNGFFVESLGYLNGPLAEIENAEYGGTSLKCVYVDGVSLYGYCSSEMLSVESEAKSSNPLTIFPNQVENNLTINSPINQTIMVYDLLGKQVYAASIIKGKNIIDLSFLTPQLYVLNASNGKARVSQKFMKL